MVLQSLVLIAAMVLVSAAVMTSSLISARTALHARALALSHTAMTTSLADFQNWAATIVKTQSARARWPTTVTTEFKPLCPSTTNAGACNTYLSAKWIVTGATSSVSSEGILSNREYAQAKNLSAPLDEQRLSATISIDLVNSRGKATIAATTMQTTLRLFDASPYVVVTGTRQTASLSALETSAEGDSGGAEQNPHIFAARPNPENPSALQDTRLATAVDCVNSALAQNQNDPYQDIGVDSLKAVRSEGNLIWAYETPCKPNYSIPLSNLPEYLLPMNGVYTTISGDRNQNWIKQNNKNAFPY